MIDPPTLEPHKMATDVLPMKPEHFKTRLRERSWKLHPPTSSKTVRNNTDSKSGALMIAPQGLFDGMALTPPQKETWKKSNQYNLRSHHVGVIPSWMAQGQFEAWAAQ